LCTLASICDLRAAVFIMTNAYNQHERSIG
jgi:hypothetical protein